MTFALLQEVAASPPPGSNNTVVGLVTALFAFLAALAKLIQERSSRIRAESQARIERAKLTSILEPRPIGPNERRIAFMMLGLGGSGKTTIIDTWLGAANRAPQQKTEEFEIFESTIKLASPSFGRANTAPLIKTYISDYRGQNLGSLVRGVLVAQKLPYSPLAYGLIRSLIIVVDVVPPPNGDGQVTPKNQELNTERIDSHNQQWNESALEAIFGLLTSSLAYVCLFINKTDALRTPLSDENLKSHFEPLIRRLEAMRRDNQFRLEVITGAALLGNGYPEFKRALVAYSEAPSV